MGGSNDSTAGCRSVLETSGCLGRCQVGARTTGRQLSPGLQEELVVFGV